MIHVENLTKNYNEFCAVDQISLHIQKGEILGLLGPNGAGKTTTLRMLTGFFPPTSGSIQVKDYNIYEDVLDIKKLIGYLPESAPLYHNMLVLDYLEYIANIREINGKEKISRIREMANLCGLNNIMHKTIDELSKGLKQRVGLAHAMISDPEILILDEPTSGLDPNQIVEIRDIIREIGKTKTIILSTHILSEAEATCDRVVIINQGKIVADDSAENLKFSASKEFFINLSVINADFASIDKELRSIDGIINIEKQESSEPDVISALLTCQSSSLNLRQNIYKKIKQTDWILIEMSQETKSLENIFRELTKEG